MKNESDKVFKRGTVKVTQNKHLGFASNEMISVAPGDTVPMKVEVSVVSRPEVTKAPEPGKPTVSVLPKTGESGISPILTLILIGTGTILLLASSKEKRKKHFIIVLFIAVGLSVPVAGNIVQAQEVKAEIYEYTAEVTLEGVTETVLFTVSFYPEEAGKHDEKYDASSITTIAAAPFKTVYVAADAYEGKQTIKQEGKDSTRYTTVYLNEKYPAEEELKGGQDKIIGVGNLKEERSETPYKTIFEADKTGLYGEEDIVKQEGKEGAEIHVYSYPVNPDTGDVDFTAEGVKVSSETLAAVDEIILRATRVEKKTEIPFDTKIEYDLEKALEYENVREGENGYDLTIGYYAMDEAGKVDTSAMAGVIETKHKDPVDKVITRGVEWREKEEKQEIPFETEVEYFITKEKADSWTSAADFFDAMEEFDAIAYEYYGPGEYEDYTDDYDYFYYYYEEAGKKGERTIRTASAYNKDGEKVGEKGPVSEITVEAQNAKQVHRGFSFFVDDHEENSENITYVADETLNFGEQTESYVRKDIYYKIPFDFDNGDTVKYLLRAEGLTEVHVGNIKEKADPEILEFDVKTIPYVYYLDEFDPDLLAAGGYEGLVHSAENENGESYYYILKEKGVKGSVTNCERYTVNPDTGELTYKEDFIKTVNPVTEERYVLKTGQTNDFGDGLNIRQMKPDLTKQLIDMINAYREENNLSPMAVDADNPLNTESVKLGCIVARRMTVPSSNLAQDEIGSVDLSRQRLGVSWLDEPVQWFFDILKDADGHPLLKTDEEFKNAYVGIATSQGMNTWEDNVYFIFALDRYSDMNAVDSERYQMEGRTLPN